MDHNTQHYSYHEPHFRYQHSEIRTTAEISECELEVETENMFRLTVRRMSSTPDNSAALRVLVQQLRDSVIYREYEQSFTEVIGLPLALRGVNSLGLQLHELPKKPPFCALMATMNKSCSACLEFQSKVEQAALSQPETLECYAGLSESAVPIRVGEHVVAFLQTGQVLLRQPTKQRFRQTQRELLKRGVAFDVKKLERAYFQTRVLSRKHYEAILRLLAIFARQLAALSNQLMLSNGEPDVPMIAKAKLYIFEHLHEELGLTQVARSAHTSSYYFCKKFKEATGLTFTEYLGRVRIERVKDLLQHRHKRISEVAFAAGFQSLSQFNRVFRKFVGESPTVWRDKLLHDSAA